MRISRQAVLAAQTCAICDRTLLVGERAVRYSPDEGEHFVDVCPLCQEIALESGWIKEGSPMTPNVHPEPRRRRPGLGGLFELRSDASDAEWVAGAVAVLCPAFWVVWAFLFRGGYTFYRGGLRLRRADGRPAARWQCALRALLVWAPVSALLLLALLAGRLCPQLPWLSFGLWAAAVALLIGYVVLALASPDRGPHDRLVGTWLVPE